MQLRTSAFFDPRMPIKFQNILETLWHPKTLVRTIQVPPLPAY